MKTFGKVILATIIAYIGFLAASFVGGFLAGACGAIFHLSTEATASLTWTTPKVLFLGVLVLIYVWLRRKKASERPNSNVNT